MMKLSRILVAVAVAGAFAAPAQADPIYWTNWTSKTAGSPGSASGTISFPSSTVTVSCSGEIFNAIDQGDWSQHPGTYNSSAVDNAPTPNLVSIQLIGGNSIVNTISFSSLVYNPVMAIQSLGSSDTASYVFTQPFTLLSQGGGHWGGGSASLSVVGNTLTGNEGNGTIQFHGSFSSISWTVPDGENYHMFTIGAPVPEPETYAMMLAGLGLLGFIARRRKQGPAPA